MAIPMLVYGAMAGLQLLSGVQQANNIQRQAELQKKLDEFNIEQAQLDAFQAEADGYTQSARYENVINAIESTQRNIYYANDVNPGFGTAADIQADTKVTGKLNLLDIQSQAHQKALGYKKQALGIKTQSGMNQLGASLQATSARNTAILGAANTALTGYERNTAILGAANTALTGYERNYGFGDKKVMSGVDKELLGQYDAEESVIFGKDVGNSNYDAFYGWAPRRTS